MHNNLSMSQALMLNINIILGAGVFINAPVLAARLGPWGWLCYLLVAGAIAPLAWALSRLMDRHQGGSFFAYALPVGYLSGFMSQWGYFVGKLAASTLGMYLAVLCIEQLVESHLPALALSGALIAIAVLISAGNVRIARQVQYFFFASKLIVLMSIISGAFWMYMQAQGADWGGVPREVSWWTLWTTLPLALYSFTGFEATCSLASQLAHARRDGPWAIMGSFIICVILAVLFQISMGILLGSQLTMCSHGADALARAIVCVVPDAWADLVRTLLVINVAWSCLGSAYGSLYSNGLNLLFLAERQQMPGGAWLARRTRSGAAAHCYVIAGGIMLLYLGFSRGNIIPLQQTNSVALLITFGLSCAGLYRGRVTISDGMVGMLGMMSCGLLLLAALLGIQAYGVGGLVPFGLLLAVGWGWAITHARTAR